MTRGARGFMGFLREKANRIGESWWGQQRMAYEMDVHRSTINRWVAELVASGDLESTRRGSTSNLYRIGKTPVEKRGTMSQNATTDVAKCDNATLELNFQEEKKASIARKPPSSEVTNYRTEFGQEWHRLHQGWVEPAGRRVEPQIRLGPPLDIIPALADSARSAGLSPSQAILSLDRAVCNAEERVNRARNPPGLIIHIARALWKTA